MFTIFAFMAVLATAIGISQDAGKARKTCHHNHTHYCYHHHTVQHNDGYIGAPGDAKDWPEDPDRPGVHEGRQRWFPGDTGDDPHYMGPSEWTTTRYVGNHSKCRHK